MRTTLIALVALAVACMCTCTHANEYTDGNTTVSSRSRRAFNGCSKGFRDITGGKPRHWRCGSGCDGGLYTTGSCACACQPVGCSVNIRRTSKCLATATATANATANATATAATTPATVQQVWVHHRNTLCRPYPGFTMEATTFASCKVEALASKSKYDGFIWNPSANLAAAYEDGATGVCKFVIQGATCAPGQGNGAGHWDSFVTTAISPTTNKPTAPTTNKPTEEPCANAIAQQQTDTLLALERLMTGTLANTKELLLRLAGTGVETAELETASAALEAGLAAQRC